jgi:uncharacterized protein YggE
MAIHFNWSQQVRIHAISLLPLFSAPLWGQQGVTSTPVVPQITASAHGETRVSPDRATIQISVQTRASTAAAAASENATKQKAVFDAIRALGVQPDQLSTINYNVYPEQRYEQNREPVITGYNVTNTLLVDVRKLSLVGPIIDAALSKGANMITSLQFYASNTEAARRTAIGSAVQKARADAEAAARAAGGTLGGLLEITLGTSYSPPPRPMVMARDMAATAAAQETLINPGEQMVSVDLTTRWGFVPGGR